MTTEICSACGQLQGVEEYNTKLWEMYHRLKSGVQHYEALVFHSDWLQENIHDDEDNESLMGAMERDMFNRGLCPKCGRPNLTGKTDEDFNTESDAKELAEMYAEQAAERRAGC